MVPVVVRAPRYLGRFACIGAACEDHCCSGWGGIDVDAPTAAAFRQVVDPALGPLIARHVRPNPDHWGGLSAATIPIPDGQACPFLHGGLCAIQRTLGEEALPTTCDTFPRQATLVDERLDLAARLACPEAARLALLADDAFVAEDTAPDRRLRERARFWVEVPWEDTPAPTDPRRHYHLVRDHTLALLGRRDRPLAARLEALGRALAALQRPDGFAATDVGAAFETASSPLLPLGSPHPPAPSPARGRGGAAGGALDVLLRRLRPWLGMPNVPLRYRACLDRLRTGLDLPGESAAPSPPGIAAMFADARQRYLDPYLAARPWLLEHLLLNVVWLGNVPYHPVRTFVEEHALLCTRVGLMVVHLVGAAAAERGLTDALVVETVQAFEKYADGEDFWDRTLRLLGREGWLVDAAVDPVASAALMLA